MQEIAQQATSNESGHNESEDNRRLVRALLALKKISLMSLVAQRTQDCPEKLDYGNASAWLRGVPGRLSVNKQRALLSLLGYDAGHSSLYPDKLHVWWPNQEEHDEDVRFLLERLGTSQHDCRRRIVSHLGKSLGWTLKIGGATVIFRIASWCKEETITGWFKRIGLDKMKTLAEKNISQKNWDRCRDGERASGIFWDSEGLQPEDLDKVIQAISKVCQGEKHEIRLQDGRVIVISLGESGEDVLHGL